MSPSRPHYSEDTIYSGFFMRINVRYILYYEISMTIEVESQHPLRPGGSVALHAPPITMPLAESYHRTLYYYIFVSKLESVCLFSQDGQAKAVVVLQAIIKLELDSRVYSKEVVLVLKNFVRPK